MASIKMCDFCGKVSNAMAAEVMIRIVDPNADFATQIRSAREMQMDASIKDCCHDCVAQFTKVRELKILEASSDL